MYITGLVYVSYIIYTCIRMLVKLPHALTPMLALNYMVCFSYESCKEEKCLLNRNALSHKEEWNTGSGKGSHVGLRSYATDHNTEVQSVCTYIHAHTHIVHVAMG